MSPELVFGRHYSTTKAPSLSSFLAKVLYFEFTLSVLGELRVEGGKKRVVTVYRGLPLLTAICHFPSEEEYNVILSSGLEEGESSLAVGSFAVGDSDDPSLKVLFSPSRFQARRTAVFGRTRYGKSNLTKLISAMMATTGNVGVLILDMNGEYAFKTEKDQGLGDIPALAGPLAVYTRRNIKPLRKIYPNIPILPLFFDASQISPRELAGLMPDFEDAPATARLFRRLRRETWNDFMRKYRQAVEIGREDRERSREDRERSEEQREEAMEILFLAMRLTSPDDVQRKAIWSRLPQVLDTMDNSVAGHLAEDILAMLLSKMTVVLDLSLVETAVGLRLASFILNKVLRHAAERYTDAEEKTPIVAIFEEAQNILNQDMVKIGDSVFVRWAKEGGKMP